jgi:hypothetical protein
MARTVTAPPGRDTVNSATSPIRSSASLKLQVGGPNTTELAGHMKVNETPAAGR